MIHRSVLRAVLTVLALVCTGPAVASPAIADPPFPGYVRLCGHAIDIEPTAHLSKAELRADGTPRIVLDPALLQPRQGFHRTFLIAHECAHHRMAHTSPEGLKDRLGRRHAIRDQELSADCWAAETLTRAGMLPQLLRIADEFWRRGFVSPGGGYPSGIQRSNVIRHCATLAADRMRAEHIAGLAEGPVRDMHP